MRIAVITTFVAGEMINFFREAALVKSASLYADAIEVLSFSSLVYTDWGAIDADEASALKRALITPEESNRLPTFTTKSDRVAADSGVNELLPAVRANLISINDRLPSTGDVWGSFIEEIVRYLADPEYVVLLDDRLSGIVSSLISKGRVAPTQQDLEGSAEAVLGAGLIARLPSFTEIPMDEILDLRRDLQGPLVRYRSAVAGMRSQELDPYSPSRNEVIDFVWRQQVAPALLDIEEDLREHGLIRELARSLRADIRDVVKGLPLRSALAVAGGSAAQFDETIQAAAAAVFGLIPTISDAGANRRDARREIARRDFYYLYRLNRAAC